MAYSGILKIFLNVLFKEAVVNKYLPVLFCFLLSTSSAIAQTPEVFQARANVNNDHQWVDSANSNRFTVWYSTNPGDCAGSNLTDAHIRRALNELETIYDVFVHRDGFPPPYAPNATNRPKMGAWVLRNGTNCTNAPNHQCGTGNARRPCCNNSTTCSEGHAFGGTIGNPRAPGMWLGAGTFVDSRNPDNFDRWAFAHEFMHGLQQMAGGMSGGNTNQGTNFRGWFHESHANLTPHQVYPNEVHFCAEMYTRMSHLYLGSTRNHYCNWQFFEYLNHRYGPRIINELWLPPPQGVSNHDPFTEFMRRNNVNQAEFGDIFGDFARRAVIWDINRHGQNNTPSVFPNEAYANRGSALFRGSFNRSGLAERYRRQRHTYLEALDSTDGANGRFVVPFAKAPQRYGFNIIRLYPDEATGTVTVRFRGDVQTENNIRNYTKNLNLEPAVAHLPNDPGSDWRYGLVAVRGDAAATGGTVTARYSELMRASDGNPNVSIEMQSGETQLYLVVAATPTVHHRISWDQFYYTIYRFPYMVEINGASPEGFQPITNPAGRQHANGGGFVANTATVAATAFVGPNARVLGNAQVQGNARIEGRAVVRGGTVRGNAIVRDYAMVAGGTIEGSAIISEGANIWNGTFTGNARAHGAANVIPASTQVSENAQVGGVIWLAANNVRLSGTAQLLGDGEIHTLTASSGVYYGYVGSGQIGNNQYGGNRTAPPTEVTAPRSMQWYGDDTNTVQIRHAVPTVARSFSMNNRGVFTYNLGSDNIGAAQLKIFDVRGRLIRTVQLSGTQGTVDTRVAAAQTVFWRVETSNGKALGKTGRSTLVR
jgi:hypothetical protein